MTIQVLVKWLVNIKYLIVEEVEGSFPGWR
jgi:hypothetical protein